MMIASARRVLLDAKQKIPFEPGEEKLLRANYAGNVTLIDDQIGEIFDVIEQRGEMDNTVVVADVGSRRDEWRLRFYFTRAIS